MDTRSYGEIIPNVCLSEAAKKMVEMEKNIPVQIELDLNLRIKVVDECGHACKFCHNEGTRVNPKQIEYRSSVFLPKSGGFEADRIVVDENFIKEVVRIKEYFGVEDIHLTGGEPTQNTYLVEIIRTLKKLGLKVKMTSNGETGGEIYKQLVESGLDGVNFSLLGSTPEEYAETQPEQFGLNWARFKLKKSKEAIESAKKFGLVVKTNCLMSSVLDEQRITSLINRSEKEGTLLRILNNLGRGKESIAAIYNLLAKLEAIPVRKKIVAGASTSSIYYRMPNGSIIEFKQIRPVRLSRVCDSCFIDKKGECEEGFYGIRLYKDRATGKYKIGVCIQRMDDFTLNTDDFFSSDIPKEILRLRDEEYKALTNNTASAKAL